jgi:alkylhydroperoxidase/carboxymuconolactone decarboxylase family protein YurZ
MASDESEDERTDSVEAFEEAVGSLSEGDAAWQDLDPESFAAYAQVASHPWNGNALSDRTKALLSLAVRCAVTSGGDPPREYVRRAFDQGATKAEILEAALLASAIGVHSIIEGMPAITRDESGGAASESARADREQVREEFEKRRGYWSPIWQSVLDADHEYLAAYTELSALPAERTVLDPKIQEFVYIAVDISTTHLYEPGFEIHLENARDHGATVPELVEVIEIASEQGYDAIREVARTIRELD